jgi:transposase
MEQRRKLAFEVIEMGFSISEASRRAGVTRKTGRKWVGRALEEGIDAMTERSHAPKVVFGRTAPHLEQALLAKKAEYPKWGPRKVARRLLDEESIHIPLRTAERILKRHGLTAPAPVKEPVQHFERPSCGALGADSWAPTAFEAWLMKLGVKPIHGRPRHPQTQGKVERFHRTAKFEIGDELFHPDVKVAAHACQVFVQRYNWVRPHDALALEVPGSRYAPFPRKRPDELPVPQPRAGDITRKVGDTGCITLKQKAYKVGRGLIGEHVQLRQDAGGLRVFFADFPLAYLAELGPSRTYNER